MEYKYVVQCKLWESIINGWTPRTDWMDLAVFDDLDTAFDKLPSFKKPFKIGYTYTYRILQKPLDKLGQS